MVRTVSKGVGRTVAAATRSEHGGPEVRVAPGVLCEVVRAHEALGAERTAELLLAGVRPVVAGQFVRAGKALAA